MRAVQVVVCTRWRLLGEGIESLLGESRDPVVHPRLVSGAQLPERFTITPDVVICDWHYWASVAQYSTTRGRLRILLVTDTPYMSLHVQELQEMVGSGLAGVLSVRTDRRLLFEAVKAVHAGGLWLDRQTVARSLRSGVVTTAGRNGGVHLTRREAEVLRGVCAGHTNKQIALQLFVSEQTVKSHCNRLFKKFGVTNRVQLVLHAAAVAQSQPTRGQAES